MDARARRSRAVTVIAAVVALLATLPTGATASETTTSRWVGPGDLTSNQVCGDGLVRPGELCLGRPRRTSDFGSNGIAAGRLDPGTAPDYVASTTEADQIQLAFGNGNGTFGGLSTKGMGDGPSDVAMADFNGDGRTDVVATNVHADRVVIRWGHTNWTTASAYGTGDNPWRVRTADLNGDGLGDFVTTDTIGDTLTVRRRLPGGGFDIATYPAGDSANDLALVDCDGDGDRDLLHGVGLQDGKIAVRPNDGTGTFGAPQGVSLGAGHGYVAGLAVADFNGDGRVDIVASLSNHQLVRVLGQGGCAFGPPVKANVPNNPFRVHAVDLNVDGTLDFAVTHLLNQDITVYLNKGDGNFVGPLKHLVAGHTFGIDSADFNLDGVPDLAVTTWPGVHVLLSNP